VALLNTTGISSRIVRKPSLSLSIFMKIILASRTGTDSFNEVNRRIHSLTSRSPLKFSSTLAKMSMNWCTCCFGEANRCVLDNGSVGAAV
jgi:hypothetical protein